MKWDTERNRSQSNRWQQLRDPDTAQQGLRWVFIPGLCVRESDVDEKWGLEKNKRAQDKMLNKLPLVSFEDKKDNRVIWVFKKVAARGRVTSHQICFSLPADGHSCPFWFFSARASRVRSPATPRQEACAGTRCSEEGFVRTAQHRTWQLWASLQLIHPCEAELVTLSTILSLCFWLTRKWVQPGDHSWGDYLRSGLEEWLEAKK